MPNFALPNNFNPNAVAPQQVAVAPAMDRNIQGNDLDRMRQPPDLLDLAYKVIL
jgi:hypothetical protein